VTLLGLLRVPEGLRIPRQEARPPWAARLFVLRPLVRERATAKNKKPAALQRASVS
jgi:hypothetical protein